MLDSDFVLIKWFTSIEVENTAARIADVEYELISMLDRLRTLTDEEINLIFNGLTTGNHKSKLHPKGLVADVFSSYDPVKFVMLASYVGFTEIGVYKNKKGVYSYHLGIGKHRFKSWYATKTFFGKWKYTSLKFGG